MATITYRPVVTSDYFGGNILKEKTEMNHDKREVKQSTKPSSYMMRLLEAYKAEGGIIRFAPSSKPRKRLSVAKLRIKLELAAVRRL